jgi:hypothetical protein
MPLLHPNATLPFLFLMFIVWLVRLFEVGAVSTLSLIARPFCSPAMKKEKLRRSKIGLEK